MDNTKATDPFYALTLRLKETLGCDRCTFFLVDRAKHEVWSKAAIGLEIAEIRLPTHRGVVGYVARTGRMLNLKDVYNDPRFDRDVDQQTGYRTKSMLTMAIKDAAGEVVGVLQALNKLDGIFTAEDELAMKNACADGLGVIGTTAS
jgi:GAF domain-containing protein